MIVDVSSIRHLTAAERYAAAAILRIELAVRRSEQLPAVLLELGARLPQAGENSPESVLLARRFVRLFGETRDTTGWGETWLASVTGLGVNGVNGKCRG
jgi:hypothetical protein